MGLASHVDAIIPLNYLPGLLRRRQVCGFGGYGD